MYIQWITDYLEKIAIHTSPSPVASAPPKQESNSVNLSSWSDFSIFLFSHAFIDALLVNTDAIEQATPV